MKCIGINITKDVHNQNKNYKTLLRKIKEDLNKWRDIPCSWIGGLNIVSFNHAHLILLDKIEGHIKQIFSIKFKRMSFIFKTIYSLQSKVKGTGFIFEMIFPTI